MPFNPIKLPKSAGRSIAGSIDNFVLRYGRGSLREAIIARNAAAGEAGDRDLAGRLSEAWAEAADPAAAGSSQVKPDPEGSL